MAVRKAKAEPGLRAVDGRTPGKRGQRTRERLLTCTVDLLERTGYRDLTVIEIARCAGTSPATFYQYFPDVEEAVLVLARAMADEGKHLPDLIRTSSWKGNTAPKTALTVVDAFLEFWERNRAVMRVVDLATLEGDLRFQNIRTHLLNEVTVALARVVEDQQLRAVEPTAHAATIVSMLAHVASHRYGYEFWGIKMADVRRSLARITYTSVTGKAPPRP